MKLLNEIQQKIKAPKTQYNTHGKYKYRSCSDILSAVKPYLESSGAFLHMTDNLMEIGGRNYYVATVTLQHGSEKIVAQGYAREAEEQKGMNAGQLSCATSSYARKQALSGLFAIDDSHDAGGKDNGNGAPQKSIADSVEEVLQQYIKDNTKDIPEHFHVDSEKWKTQLRTLLKKSKKNVEYTTEGLKEFTDQIKLADVLVEE